MPVAVVLLATDAGRVPAFVVPRQTVPLKGRSQSGRRGSSGGTHSPASGRSAGTSHQRKAARPRTPRMADGGRHPGGQVLERAAEGPHVRRRCPGHRRPWRCHAAAGWMPAQPGCSHSRTWSLGLSGGHPPRAEVGREVVAPATELSKWSQIAEPFGVARQAAGRSPSRSPKARTRTQRAASRAGEMRARLRSATVRARCAGRHAMSDGPAAFSYP